MNQKIFIVMHKDAKVPCTELYTPIIVGKKSFAIQDTYYRDDVKDNIAQKNASYCELTALYWIWKNIKEYDIIGLCHYRRYFVKEMKKNFEDLLQEKEIESYLNDCDIILPQKKYFLKETIKHQYYSANKGLKKDYEVLEEVIRQIEPDYVEAFEKVSKEHSTYLYNMFITKKEILNDYCEWVFKILFEVEKRVDISGYTTQQKRIFGYLSERLMTVYVEKNKLKVKEVKIINMEEDLGKQKYKMLKNHIKKIILKGNKNKR